MASLYKKVISGRPYWYLREMGWVDGKPKMISERYVGTAAEVEALLDVREQRMVPARTRHLEFGAVAAVWGLLTDLGVATIIDEAAGTSPAGLPLSPGTYLALAVLNRVVDPCSKRRFADWWRTTAGDRFTKIAVSALDHRRFWDAMHAVPLEALPRIEEKLAAEVCARFGLDTGSVALDMTNFATFIDTGNDKAPIAQRGKAKQKRADLRLVGLGLVVTRDGGVPLLSHAYPGNKPDVTQFPHMISTLAARHTALAAATGRPDTEMTVVFDAGQNSQANFAVLADTKLHYVGSVPASDCRDLLALPAAARSVVDTDRFDDLTAHDTRRSTYGTDRRTILTHSVELHEHQARGFTGTTLAKVGHRLDELAATLARGKTRRARGKVEAEITMITSDAWVRRVVDWRLTGEKPAELRLNWTIDPDKQAALETEIFGKHVLITDHDDWPVAEVVAAYRSQSEAEFGFRQMKDPHAVSFSPMYHWTEHNIRIHVFTCVLALQIAHLMRLHARRAGLRMSVRRLLDQLAGIEETVLIYPTERGRPKARRMLTETTPDQDKLIDIFQLDRHRPRS
ncbi:MAG: IS1634 family transposase [Thermoanaerobaculales bacterium]|nr:IS1634 family transposase [Thermoanaerobaculales bacterium]